MEGEAPDGEKREAAGIPGFRPPPAGGGEERPDDALRGARALRRDLSGTAGEAMPAAAGDARRPLPRFGDYEILKKIGGGGMGDVYLARQRSLDREVALKVLTIRPADNSPALDRFFREAKALGAIRHPSIVAVHEAGVEDGRPFIAMEFVRGTSLAEVIKDGGRLPVQRALEVTRDIARALQAAHEAGVVHRDIKPGNILVEGDVRSEEFRGRAYLADFGLADLAGDASITLSGEILGTPSYMSPEQARGLPAGRPSDVYSLGATLYAMLAGRAPHEGSSSAAVLAKVIGEDPVPVRVLNPSVDRDAAVICGKAMAWDADRRYRSAADLAGDLERRLAGRPILARPAGWVYRTRLWLRRNPKVPATAGIIVGLILGAFAGWRGCERADTLDSVERSLAEERIPYDVARQRIEGAPGLPWPLADTRKSFLRVRLLAKEGNLGEAMEEAKRLPSGRRAEAMALIREEIDRRLRSAEDFLRDGMWRSALDASRKAMEGIAAAGGVEAPREWIDLWIRALLAVDEDPLAVELHEAKTPVEMRDIFAAALEASPHRFDVNKLLAYEAAKGALSREFLPPGDDALARARELLGSLDSFLPDISFTGEEEVTIRRWARFFGRLTRVGARAIPAPACLAAKDIDGDGNPELFIATGRRIQALRCRKEGFGPLLDRDIEREGRIGSMALEDLDGDGRAECIVTMAIGQDGIAAAFRVDGEVLVPFGGEVDIHAAGASPCRGIAVADLDRDGRPEVYLGIPSPYGPNGRSVVVIRHPVERNPFAPGAEVSRLPFPDGCEAEVSAVFPGDFDGDGETEMGAATGPWHGWDLRFWKLSGGEYRGPLRYGPVGTLDGAVALDGVRPAGDHRSEVFLVKTSRLSANAQFSSPDRERGLEEGAYLFRLPDGDAIRDRQDRDALRRPENYFPWREPVGEKIGLEPDRIYMSWISAGRCLEGKSAVAVAWSMRKGKKMSQSVDLYVRSPRPDSFTRQRVYQHEGDGDVRAELVEFTGPDRPSDWGLVFLRSPAGPAGGYRAELYLEREPPREDPLVRVEPGILQVHVRWMRYRRAMDLARSLCRRKVEPAGGVLMLWAVAADRAADWDTLDEVLGGSFGPVPEFEGKRILEDDAREGWRLAGAEAVSRIPGAKIGDAPVPVGCDAPPRSLPVEIHAPSDIRVTFDLDIECLDFSRSVFVGLVPEGEDLGAVAVEGAYGVFVQQRGGTGHTTIETVPYWDGSRDEGMNRDKLLRAGRRYRFSMERTSAGRIIVRVEDREAADSVFWIAHPPYGDAVIPPEASPEPATRPLPAGRYRFGIFDFTSGQDLGKHRDLRFAAVELRCPPEM